MFRTIFLAERVVTSLLAAEPDQPDPATLGVMVRRTIAALPFDSEASEEDAAEQCEAAVVALMAFRPRDPMEAMLAPRIISTHHAAMVCFRRPGRPGTPDHMALRLHGKGMSLANLATRTQRVLRKCQAEPPAYPAPPLAEEASR